MSSYGGDGPAITAGSITYTTSTTADGRIIYHPFKAVPASYNTPKGVVSGIQWVPAEATSVLPPGARPADEDFAASWNRGQLSPSERQALKDWQRDEEKRRRHEEKAAAKKLRHGDRSSPTNRTGGILGGILGGTSRTDPDLQRARERDQVFPSAGGSLPFPTSGPNPYTAQSANTYSAQPTNPYAQPTSPYNQPINPYGAQQMPPGGSPYPAFERERKHSNNPQPYPAFERDRKPSNNMYAGSAGSAGVSDLTRGFGDLDTGHTVGNSGLVRPRKYSTNSANNNFERSRKTSNNLGMGSAGYDQTGFGRNPSGSQAGGHTPYSASPNLRPGEVPFVSTGYDGNNPYPTSSGVQGTNVYPPNHILAGQPIPGAQMASGVGGMLGGIPVPFPSSRTHSRNPSRNPSPRIPSNAQMQQEAEQQQLLAAPAGFSRPLNSAQAYTPFEPMRIQEMNDILQALPPLPRVLQSSHDVYLEDWVRFTQDLCLAWSDRLPVPDLPRGRPSKRALSADLIELWNDSFFLARGIEAILFKGRERRSGPRRGEIDMRLPVYDEDDNSLSSSSSSSSESSDSEASDSPPRGMPVTYDVYGRPTGNYQTNDALMAKQRRREKRAEKKKRRKEKKLRRKLKAKANQYVLYLMYVPPNGAMGAARGTVGGMQGQSSMQMPSVPGYAGSGGGGYAGSSGNY